MKRILLNWDINRPDLFAPFIELKNDFEFIILWRGSFLPGSFEYPFKEIFFTDFKTPYQLLEEIKPDKIIFFNLTSFPQIALNLAAKNKGILTFTMHHGVYTSDGFELNKRKEEYNLVLKRKLVSNLSSLYFYFSALRFKNIDQFFNYVYFAWLRQRRNVLVATEKCVFDGRIPGYHIQLSPHNSIVTKRINHLISDEKFIYIGHPNFDSYFKEFEELKEKNGATSEKYFLLIDFPNISSSLSFKIMGAEGKRNFYKRLSSVAKSFGCRLKIKLHPSGFYSEFNYQDDNIDLIREADIVPLIHFAQKCFSFFSTLVIPVIFENRFCYLFNVGMNIKIQDELVQLGVAKLLDYKNFSEDDLKGELTVLRSNEGYETFIERYLFYTDGKATERLKNLLSD